MNKLEMKVCGDLVLREKCEPVENITQEILDNMDEMIKMMQEQSGVGMAAPQVGITKRFLVMMDPDTNVIYRMINPEIISRSDETCVMEEGCLSVLGADGLPVYSNVRRPKTVEVKWTNEKGEHCQSVMTNTLGRIVQHETDHLDGILFIDYLSGVKREMLMRKVNRGH